MGSTKGRERATHGQDTVLFAVLAHLALRNRRGGRDGLVCSLVVLTGRALVWTHPRCDWFGRAHLGVRLQDSEPETADTSERTSTTTRSFPWIYPNPQDPAAEPAEPALKPSEPSSLPSTMSQHLTTRPERPPTPVRPHRLLSRSHRNALRLAADPLRNEVHQQAPLPPQRLPNEEKSRLTNRIQRTLYCLLTSGHCSID